MTGVTSVKIRACSSSTTSGLVNTAAASATDVWLTDFLAGRRSQGKAEAKVAAMEARAEEQRQARARADAGWRQQQRERELRRAEEERAREKEVGAG